MNITLEQIAADVAKIRADVDHISHGNGRAGIWALSDTVFGPKGQPARGILERLEKVEAAHREGRFLQRGIAIGVSLVALDSLFGLDLASLAGRLFGQ